MEIVSALQLALADRVGQERFELWFGANTRLGLDDGVLTVRVPNQFFQDWLRNNFREHIETACIDTLGVAVPVRFQIDPTLKAAPAKTAPQQGAPEPAASNPLAVPAYEAVPPRRAQAALDRFVVGPTNRLAFVAAHDVVSRPGHSSPLVIHGPTSVGKTHLLEGILTAVKRSTSRLQAIYLSAEQFTTLFLGALHGSGLPSFRRKYRGLDLLIIDDVQFFAGKRATLVELLNTIDTFQREGRQLVFAADRPPSELTELGAELMTRLQGGLVCSIDPPELETRRGIIARLAERMQLDVPSDVQEFIAARFHSHARELAGALNRLDAASRAWERAISLELAQEALAEMIRHSTRSVRLADIEQAVCRVFGLEPQSLQSGRKGKEINHPRMLAMWLARKHTRAALSEIGRYFGRRSHSTVILAQKKVEAWMADGAAPSLSERGWSAEEAIRRVEQKLLAG